MRRLLLALLLLLPFAARAQDRAALVADRLFVTEGGLLVAEGNVQAFFEGSTLSASRVTYDREADRLLLEGPILIRDPSGAILAAERADLDARLEQGLLEGARLVLDRQVQIAANRVDRVGSLTALTGASATSCRVCGRAPLWEITADRVVRDEAAERLYFDRATFRVRGLPILWLPRVSLPEPGNTRATGVLVPRLRSTNQLGAGVQVPFFLELGPARDLTLAPYLSPGTRTLDLRFRQAFLRGDLAVEAAGSRDGIRPGQTRGFARARGAFALGPGAASGAAPASLSFDVTVTSDDAYLLDYGWSDEDRIESVLALSAVGADALVLGEVVHVRSLREGEADGSLPPVLGSLSAERRRPLGGGVLTFGAGLDGFARTAEGRGEGSEDGSGAEARDVARAGVFAGWRRGWVGPGGLLVEAEGRAALDAFRVWDDPAAGDLLRAAPAAALALRWPLVREGARWRDLVEPAAALGWSDGIGGDPPEEDSLLAELDEANLFALTRLPGEDDVEDGARLSLGASWTRAGAGFASTLWLGRVLRAEGGVAASEASGVAGETSATLLAAEFDLGRGVAFDARTLLAGTGIGKTEARLDWDSARLSAEAAYVFVPSAAEERRADEAAEWSAAAAWRPSDRWELRLGGRYDLAADRPARAEAGVVWRNECVEVDASVARRYTEAGGAEPSTSFGLSVNLLGFGVEGVAAEPGACRDRGGT